jgi:nitrogen fixation protein FixH
MTPSTARSARWTWTLAIAGLLAANVVAMATLAVVAHRDAAQVIPDYYARATRYDDELTRSAASRALGWRVDLAVASGTVDAVVSDASGRPITGARVRVTGYHRAHASERLDLELTAAAAGRYRGVIAGRIGRYDLEASVEAAGAHYSQRVTVEAR